MRVDSGSRLAELRLSRGLSQEQLAEQLGVSRQAVSNWERCESLPDTANLVSLAEFFDVSVDELLGRRRLAGGSTTLEDSALAGESRPDRWWPNRAFAVFACTVLSAAYYILVAPLLLRSTADDLTEMFGLSPSPTLAVMWFVCELIFVLVPFALIAARPLRLPRWIWVVPVSVFAIPLLLSWSWAVLGGSPWEYTGIGGALMSSVTVKADVLALAVGSLMVHSSKSRLSMAGPSNKGIEQSATS